MRTTERLVDALLPLHRAASRSRVAHALVSRISPVSTYYRLNPELDDRLQREWALLDTFDSLTDRYKHFRTAAQLSRALARLSTLGM